MDTSPDEISAVLTEFESESVIATRRIVFDAEPTRVERQPSGWGYMALLAAFLLGMCTAIVATCGWR